MDSITVRNFRCFGDEQSARLAPITLLVGDNSTGKTSMLGLIRALWDAVYADRVPDFREPPFDFGSFDEIVHYSGGDGERPESFAASFVVRPFASDEHDDSTALFEASVEFGQQAAAPVPVQRRISQGTCSVTQSFDAYGTQTLAVRTDRGEWHICETDNDGDHPHPDRVHDTMRPIDSVFWMLSNGASGDRYRDVKVEPIGASPEITVEDVDQVHGLVHSDESSYWVKREPDYRMLRPSAGAPIRSRPRRTYDPARDKPDAEGDHVPTHLAWLALHEPDAWELLKSQLEDFGRSSGLFDEINVRLLGGTANDPFQIQIRKSDGDRVDPFRNLAEIGYGVSQALPLVTELLREDSPRTALLQQPEVHLHPSAAAALGTLLCTVAADPDRDRRLIVETHSDFIIDRVRMAARDGVAGIEPEDISILYFERRGPGVHIHTLRVDELGNLLDAPPGYRRFFMEESRRFLGT